MLAFVYGTLTDPGRVAAVVESFSFEGAATLEGLRRVDGRYPTLAPPAATADARVAGRLLRTPDEDALDAYEGVDRGLYVRVAVPATGREERATVYVGDPAKLGVAGAVTWPGEGPLARRVRRYVRQRNVVVRPA